MLVMQVAWADIPPVSANTPQKAVLVTGASSGIGLKITEVLAAKGYVVYAGARKEEDLLALNKIANVQSIRLDVTKQEDIDNAVNTISKAGRGLYGLVNNAGVASFAPMTELDEKDFDFLMNVNMYGPYRMTKAFSPLIVESKGRIIMIGSLFGVMAMPNLGSYAMSKHAIEAFADTLAAEMFFSGVKVVVVEPGSYKSQIYKNMYKRVSDENSNANKRIPDWQKAFLEKGDGQQDSYQPPDKVAEAVFTALSAKSPHHRYMVVPEPEQAKGAIAAAIKTAVQLNEGYEQPLDRAELIKMLDDEMDNKKSFHLKK